MQRIVFYTFWEKDGIVHDYVTYYLDAIKKVSDKVVVVVNGLLSREGEATLKKHDVDFFVRENIGFDFSSWKAALEREGWDNIRTYDELILCSCSCYGPVYPFENIFENMKEKSCDFWGLYRHPDIEGFFPAHLQSYFLVIRKSLLFSQEFYNFWQELTPAQNWNEAVAQETSFTHYFETKGFIALSYIKTKSTALFRNPTIPLVHKLLTEDKFPLIMRNVFTENYQFFFDLGNASQAKETIEILEKLNYPVDHIYQDLLQTMQGSALRKVLHHTFVLPDFSEVNLDQYKNKVAIIIFSYYEELIDENIAYMQSMPAESDAYIVVVSNRIKTLWEQKKNKIPCKNVVIRKQVNRGRNENAYWLTCRDVIEGYDFICVAHDKKTPSDQPAIRGHYFSRHCWDNILKSPSYVRSIINLMESRPELGILMPPLMSWGKYRGLLDDSWQANKQIAKEIYAKLNLHIPFDEYPDAPWGAMFWLRGKAMAPFYRYEWSLEDFPEEPIPVADGTILHAMERMYPMIAQEAGYFSAWIMPQSEAGVHFDNMYHLAKTIYKDCVIMSRTPSLNTHQNITYEHNFTNIRCMIKAYLKNKIKNFLEIIRT